jgi:hypothetical protein
MPRVVMLLAMGPGRPRGDTADRLELELALTRQGQLDEQAWDPDAPWPMLRTLPDGRTLSGSVIRVGGGWALRSDRHEDEPLWDLSGRLFRPGEYVTLRAPDGRVMVFRVVGIEADAA